MNELHLPWLETAIIALVIGAVRAWNIQNAERARISTLKFLGTSLFCTAGAWVDLEKIRSYEAHDRWDLLHVFFGKDLLFVDKFNAPLLFLTALIGFLAVLATPRTKAQRLSYPGLLATQGAWLAMLGSREPWLQICLACISVVPQWLELVQRRKPVRVFAIHMIAHLVLLVSGWFLFDRSTGAGAIQTAGICCLVLSIMIRVGICPFHCWMTDLFEHASFAGALLFVSPMIGACLAVRLLTPKGPDWSLQFLAVAALVCSLYSAGMALVQREPRRYLSFLFLSHSSLVLVGLETVTPEALTGGLCVWVATSLSLAGLGLTLRAVESRMGRLSLDDFHGLYDHMPNLAVLFLVTGLASVGFPGTIGFVSAELLVDGIIHEYPVFGVCVVLASALNSISILRVYFRIFGGVRHVSSISLQSRWSERIAVITLVLLMIGGGIFPQAFLQSRFDAAHHIIQDRQDRMPMDASQEVELGIEEPGAAESIKESKGSRAAKKWQLQVSKPGTTNKTFAPEKSAPGWPATFRIRGRREPEGDGSDQQS